MDIVYEDNHLLVVNKPIGWIVQGAQTGQNSLLDLAKSYIKTKYHKPGNVYLGVVSRLDGPVSGLVPLARTSKAASRLSEQIRIRAVKKVYWAIVTGKPPKPSDRIEHWLVRQESDTITRVATRTAPNAQQAILEYRTLGMSTNNSSIDARTAQTWLEIELVTGRKHQIRAQLAAMGCPILGDAKYGSSIRFSEGIALHCSRLVFQHPIREEKLDLKANPPKSWPNWMAKP
ncbi:MAG: RluA family pseudouridine synthase [Pirellula sp.]|jgi:23S rRNA pseudouridine1911/1915/1917 synthase